MSLPVALLVLSVFAAVVSVLAVMHVRSRHHARRVKEILRELEVK